MTVVFIKDIDSCVGNLLRREDLKSSIFRLPITSSYDFVVVGEPRPEAFPQVALLLYDSKSKYSYGYNVLVYTRISLPFYLEA